MPLYEKRTICARKPATDALVTRGEMTAAQAASMPVATFALADKGTAYDDDDRYFYYFADVLYPYIGVGGKSTFEAELRAAIAEKTDYNQRQRAFAWTMLEQNCSELIMSQVRIPPADYEANRTLLAYYWLIERIRFVYTGEGAHSVTLQIMKLLSTKVVEDQFAEFIVRFTKLITDINRRNGSADVLLQTIFNTAFHYGPRGNGNHLFTYELNQLLARPDLPDWTVTSDRITTMSIAMRGIDEYANSSNTQQRCPS